MTLAATVTLAEAAERTWGAVVVGAGPAGAAAARELARRSVAVLLVDRAAFPRWKVCGCCLNGRAAAVLRAVGLGALPQQCGAVPLENMQLAAGGRSARVPLSDGAAVSREAFDAALVAAAVAAGAAFLPETRAVLLDGHPTRGIRDAARPVQLQQGDQRIATSARVVVAADGLGGSLLARAGETAPAETGARIGAGTVTTQAPDFYQPGVVYMACGAGGYTGMVRLEDGRLDVAAAFDAAWVRAAGGPGRAADRMVREAGWPPPGRLDETPWRGTPALTRRPHRVAAERLFVVGDAAGYVEPFTGEGMAWALASGAAVAPLAACAVEQWRPELAQQWADLHRRIVGRRQGVCRAAAAVLRRPWLTRLVVRLLGHAPALAGPVIRRLNR
jgi:flavin-dependent dehydrogenase